MYYVREIAKTTKPEDKGIMVKQFDSYKAASAWLKETMVNGETRELYISSN